MSYKEISELRKSGRLEEALLRASSDLDNEPDSIWKKRAASWVYYDYIKNNTKADNFDLFINYLQKLKDLDLPEDDNMVFDSVSWRIGSMFKALRSEEQQDLRKYDKIFSIIKAYHFKTPSEGYSNLLKSFLRISDIWPGFIQFADWWDLENLQREDHLNEEFNNRKLLSLAERSYIAYAKKLLEGEPVDHYGNSRAIDKDRISAFLPKLDKFIEDNPKFLRMWEFSFNVTKGCRQ